MREAQDCCVFTVVQSGGTASNTTITSAGGEFVYGSAVSAGVLITGGVVGGVASETLVSSSGSLIRTAPAQAGAVFLFACSLIRRGREREFDRAGSTTHP